MQSNMSGECADTTFSHVFARHWRSSVDELHISRHFITLDRPYKISSTASHDQAQRFQANNACLGEGIAESSSQKRKAGGSRKKAADQESSVAAHVTPAKHTLHTYMHSSDAPISSAPSSCLPSVQDINASCSQSRPSITCPRQCM